LIILPEILSIFRTNEELISLLKTDRNLINFTVIGYMLGFKILTEYENLYENDLKEQIFNIGIKVRRFTFFLLLLSEFGGFGWLSTLFIGC